MGTDLRKKLHEAIDTTLQAAATEANTIEVDILLDEGLGVERINLMEFCEWLSAKGSVQCSYGQLNTSLSKFAMRKHNAKIRAKEKMEV